ncbi:MAG: thiolase family protein [Deltaproteobacteria bacterium]|nr:thiolase family protein [Deltaproteobacteria bacterium]
MREIAIVSITRAPIGRAHRGNLRDTRPDSLAGVVIKEALRRAEGLDPAEVGDVVLGCAFPEGEQGMNVARIASFVAGLPHEVPALTVNRFCSSGLQALAVAGGRIALGGTDVAVAGGVESMSLIGMAGQKPTANPELFDRYPEAFVSMGNTAENVASRYGVTRQAQDEFALASHQRAVAAQRAGRFTDEIVEVQTRVYEEGGTREVRVTEDEGPRPDTTLEGLAKLKPAFHATGGTVTAGSSSQLSDGAAAAVLMTRARAEELGLAPLGIFRHFVVVGVPPEVMGIGPVPAIRKLCQVSGVSLDEIDCFELNEAFAAQAIYCVRELGLDPAKVNPNGGAIALGHPLGATGAILTAKLLYELARTKGRYGVVSMCIGGGMGAAGLFERA